MSNDIQIGMPCVYEGLCFWIGAGFGAVVLFGILYFVWSAWREKQQQKRLSALRRQKRRSNSKSKN